MLSESIERELPYSPAQLFDIAADVERYPEFLRWWMAARVRDVQAKGYCTDQVLGLGPARINFASHTRLERPRLIEVVSSDRAFRHFSIRWGFEQQPGSSCRVSLSVKLELSSHLLQSVIEHITPDTASDMMLAFEARARQLYGPPNR